MRFLKASCSDCEHSADCSPQTRMYVNYCGADSDRVTDRIRSAQSECSSRKGHTLVFRRNFQAAPIAESAATG
ncbi:MAG: hypothetical protein LBH93_03080 [Chitinispirillales bacterium]|jgi:hypothetical protein|nr:hypothetical protein [Chitinispirillales bacterium]